jgi:hypothetical protein
MMNSCGKLSSSSSHARQEVDGRDRDRRHGVAACRSRARHVVDALGERVEREELAVDGEHEQEERNRRDDEHGRRPQHASQQRLDERAKGVDVVVLPLLAPRDLAHEEGAHDREQRRDGAAERDGRQDEYRQRSGLQPVHRVLRRGDEVAIGEEIEHGERERLQLEPRHGAHVGTALGDDEADDKQRDAAGRQP